MDITLNTIIVDDEQWSLERFRQQCADVERIQIQNSFTNPLKALEFAQSNRIDLAFLDVDMPGMSGIELAKRLKELYPGIIVIFVSGYEDYLPDAMRMRADYYLLKPYSRADVEDVLNRALLLSRRLERRVFIRTFGNFDVFVDMRIVSFSSAKAKELLALLVDRRGGLLTAEEAFYMLWEDKQYNNYTGAAYRKVLANLVATLEKYDVTDLLLTLPHGRAINLDACDCDLYKYLSGDPKSVKMFHGEYMTAYSWAESTLGMLINTTYRIPDEYGDHSSM